MMGNIVDIVMIYRLREGASADDAVRLIRENAGSYRGFDIEEDTGGEFSIVHNDMPFRISAYQTYGMVEDPALGQSHLIMAVDSDHMQDDEGEDNPEFWNAFENVNAVIVALVNPWFGCQTVDEQVAALFETGLEEELKNSGYYSFDYLRQRMPDKEKIIRAYATRELMHGVMINNFEMTDENTRDFRFKMSMEFTPGSPFG